MTQPNKSSGDLAVPKGSYKELLEFLRSLDVGELTAAQSDHNTNFSILARENRPVASEVVALARELPEDMLPEDLVVYGMNLLLGPMFNRAIDVTLESLRPQNLGVDEIVHEVDQK